MTKRVDEYDLATPADADQLLGIDASDTTDSSLGTVKRYLISALFSYLAQGLSVKGSARLATSAALPTNTYLSGVLTGTATGVLTVDGSAVALNDRILVKDEVVQANNGLYSCTVAGALGVAYVLTRTTDMDAGSEVPGAFAFVEAGTVNVGAGYTVAGAGPYTLGTTAIVWTQFSGAGEISVTAPITKTGNTIGITSPLPIASGGTNAATAAAARMSLQIEGRTTFSNAPYTVLTTDKYVAQVGTMSASRAVTLPAANAVPAGYMLWIADESGTVTATNTIMVTRAGSDTINGATTLTLVTAYADVILVSDGTSKWSYDIRGITRGGTGATSAAAARVNLNVDGRSTVNNTTYTVLNTDKVVAQTGTLSASRTFTLPAANTMNAGQEIIIVDESNTVTNTNTIVIARAGSDTINGASTSYTLATARGRVALMSDGVSNWTAPAQLGPTDFAASGTYTIPSNATHIRILALGAGGGGGAGRQGATNTARFGGGGGGGGSLCDITYMASELLALNPTLAITIGAAGTAGAAQSSADSDGANGGAGGNTTVVANATTVATGLGGALGGGGTAAAGTAGAAGGAANTQTWLGGAGSSSATSGTPSSGNASANAAGGGGAGGGIDSSNVARAGGNSGAGSRAIPGASISQVGGAATGAAGTLAITATIGTYGGGGSGGGARDTGGTGGTGGAGVRGGGGGGGGASLNTNNSGAGGAGGAGFVRIIAW